MQETAHPSLARRLLRLAACLVSAACLFTLAWLVAQSVVAGFGLAKPAFWLSVVLAPIGLVGVALALWTACAQFDRPRPRLMRWTAVFCTGLPLCYGIAFGIASRAIRDTPGLEQLHGVLSSVPIAFAVIAAVHALLCVIPLVVNHIGRTRAVRPAQVFA